MADPELLLTVNGVDVTPYIWDWGTLRLTDAWNQNPTLSAELRCNFTEAAGLSVPAFADVRLVNLITGDVLHEGVQASDLEQRTEDPHWVVTPIQSAGHQSLLDTSPLQADYTVRLTPYGLPPQVVDVVRDLLARSIGDSRLDLEPRLFPYADIPGYPYLIWSSATGEFTTFAAGSSLASALLESCRYSDPWDGNTSTPGYAGANGEYLPKVVPGYGLVIARAFDAFRGASRAVLTGSARPESIGTFRNDGQRASGIMATSTSAPARMVVDAVNGKANTNGYLVARGSFDAAFLYDFAGALPLSTFDAPISRMAMADPDTEYSSGAGYAIRTAFIAEDVLVGQSVTFDHPYWGTVTGTVQSVATRFQGGVVDRSGTGQPYFLDAGRTLDSGWTLDAAATSGVERHRRQHAATIAAVPRSFVGSARKYGIGARG